MIQCIKSVCKDQGVAVRWQNRNVSAKRWSTIRSLDELTFFAAPEGSICLCKTCGALEMRIATLGEELGLQGGFFFFIFKKN